MTLPSQQQRGGGRGPRLTGGRSRRRRNGGRRLLGFVVLIAIVGLVVWQWPSIFGSGPDDANADDQANTTPKTDTRPDTSSLVVDRTGTSPLDPARGDATPTNSSNRDTERNDSANNRGTFMMGQPRDINANNNRDEDHAASRPDPLDTDTDRPGVGTSDFIRSVTAIAEEHLAANRPVDARDVLNMALYRDEINATDADLLRARLSEISQTLTFSPRAYPGDTMADTHKVVDGDFLSTIPRKYHLDVDYRFIQRINRIEDPNKMRKGQSLKLIKGPFHAVVDKSAFRMDIYADQTDSYGNRLYITSFPVGLGEFGTTPVGDWVVREGAKVINPAWVNPRTGEKFDKDDPDIPIGERWIALQGTDPETELLDGYGIHGTNQPESIGMEKSMGCVRMLASDVELVYELLVGGKSTVRVVD